MQKGVHRGIELAFKYMSREPSPASSGIVLNVSDIFGVTCKLPPMKVLPAYTASRYALTALTRSFGVSLKNISIKHAGTY